MASLVARVAVAAAALPSGRARRLGSGRLPLAALPGHGAAVLAGRRAGTAHGGVLAIQFKAPARDVKVYRDPIIPVPSDDDDDDDGFEVLYSQFIAQIDRMHTGGDLFYLLEPCGELLGALRLPEATFEREPSRVQVEFKWLAKECIDLAADSMRRLTPKQRRRMLPLFYSVILAFKTVSAAAEDRRCSWGLALTIPATLDALRMMVSQACDAPTPLPWWMSGTVGDAKRYYIPAFDRVAKITEPEVKFVDPQCTIMDPEGSQFTVIDGREEAMFEFFRHLLTTAKNNVDAMISGGAPPS